MPSRDDCSNKPLRKSPRECAHLQKPGDVKVGIDGNLWIVRTVKGGVLRWFPIPFSGSERVTKRRIAPYVEQKTPKRVRTVVTKNISKTPKRTPVVVIQPGSASGYTIAVEYATSGRSKCKLCKEYILYGDTRLVKKSVNPFDSDGDALLSQFYHIDHGFDMLKRARCRTKLPERVEEIGGFNTLKVSDRTIVRRLFSDYISHKNNKC